MNRKLTTLVEYITFLLKKYGELQKAVQAKTTFRVASIKQSPNATKIIIQVIGKSTFIECTPAEIIENDAFLEKFSKTDIQKITYIHAQQENAKQSNKLKLIRQEFNITDGKTKFILKDKDGKTTLKTAAEISIDKQTINNLTQSDAINIGYIAGYKHSQINEIDPLTSPETCK